MALSNRSLQTPPFRAMAILARARELEAQGRGIVHMELGEPDFLTPQHVIEAGFLAAQEGYTSYTPAEGLLELREALSRYYRREYGINIGAERFIITMGSSPGLWLLFAAILDSGDAVLMSNPHYACYPNDVRFVGGEPITFRVFAEDGFQVDPKRAGEAITKRAKILLINSPANPTGAVIGEERMREIAQLPVEHIISDEIYHRLTYGVKAHSMLEYRDDAIVISGFSKLYAMTGWRLGWIIVPPLMVEPLRRLHQNLFLCASAFVQKAGVAALEGPQEEIEKMIATYAERRTYILSALRELGLKIPVEPQGAFYILADARHWDNNSERLSQRLLEEAGVAVTPGIDFGDNAEGFLRFCYAASLERMKEAVRRLKVWMASAAVSPPADTVSREQD